MMKIRLKKSSAFFSRIFVKLKPDGFSE